MHAKIATLTAMLMSRHKGGDSVEDWIQYSKSLEKDVSSKTQFQNCYNDILMCNAESLDFLLKNQPAFLKSTIEQLLAMARRSDGSPLDENLVKLMGLRKFLEAIVEAPSSEKAMKTLACRTILCLGYRAQTSWDLMLAAELQAKHQLDITWELMPLLDKSEKQRKYIPPGSNSGDGSQWSRYDEINP